MTAKNGTAAEKRVAEIVRELKLEKHPEGGWFAEVYTAPVSFAEGSGPWRGVSTICWMAQLFRRFIRSIVRNCGIIMKALACGCMF